MPNCETEQAARKTRIKLLLSTALIVASRVYAYQQDIAQAPDNMPVAATHPTNRMAPVVPHPATAMTSSQRALPSASSISDAPRQKRHLAAAPAALITPTPSSEAIISVSQEVLQSTPPAPKLILSMETDTVTPAPQNLIEYVAANVAQGKGRYNDGEFIGKSADTIWGDVQVKALIRDGSIIDVQFLQYPSHRRRSASISGWAMPLLRSEAIQVQSAQVDMVSQASITTEGFQQSLASALSQAAK
jgi:uncharacterized protein with FMN-binding domain